MKSRVVEIDLGTKQITTSSIDTSPWLGGRGLAVKLFTDRVDPACDPLGPDNIIVIAVSPITGTTAPTAGRGHAVFKSPLTGAIGSTNSGGKWAKIMKSAGCDVLILKGAADKPVFLSISDKPGNPEDIVSFHDASPLWGRDVHGVTDELEKFQGGNWSVLTIGPAGENKVAYASLMNEKNRAYGRSGPGAVFGAKNLKAILVSGSGRNTPADPERFKDVVAQTRHIMKAVPATKRVLRDMGTAGLVHLINIMGILPHRNFADCIHDPALVENVSGEMLSETILERAGACFGCPITCQRHTKARGRSGEGPEYETVVLMGPLVDIYDLEAVTVGNYAANELGMDTMSLGVTLSCAAELVERGAASRADLGVAFGDPSIYPEIVEKIAMRSGPGGPLADGSRALAAHFGMPDAAMHVKGLELPAYDPRGVVSQALGYMTSPTGACHLRGGYSISLAYFGGIKEVPRYSLRQAAMTTKNQQDAGIIQDSLGVCRFTGYAAGAEHWAKIFTAATGETFSREALEKAAERIATLERIFNLKAGLTRKDDDLPERFKTKPLFIEGKERLISESDRNRMLDDYYRIRGWDSDGVPLKSTCEELELEI